MDYVDFNQIKQLQELEATKRKILSSILTKEAYERLSRVRFANPEIANQVELYLLQIYQTGKLQKSITDEQMKEVLKLFSEKRDFKIKRI
ncbi:MAG: DNA-binding protein [Candidatus Aenigmatarchaeota archaeon]